MKIARETPMTAKLESIAIPTCPMDPMTGSTVAASVRDPNGNTLEVAAIREATEP
jgi:hypothetical protein